MRIFPLIAAIALLFPALALAHNLKIGERVPAVGVKDEGELVLKQDKFSYHPWNSAQLAGKVRVVLPIAGRSSAKEMNAAMIEAIKSANFPRDRYQTTTIVNTDDAIPGTGMFVTSSIKSNKQQYPWSQFVIDDNGNVQKAWLLKPAGSAVVVLDKQGVVRWVKDGALSEQEVQQAITLLHELLK